MHCILSKFYLLLIILVFFSSCNKTDEGEYIPIEENPLAELNLPENYTVTILNTGCCGMAGSFGYEKEHYKVSMQVGEDTLFPKVRNCSSDTEIAAAGTSCRHQIYDGTKRLAKHPITLLKEALI